MSVSSFNSSIHRAQVRLQIYRCVQINCVLFSSSWSCTRQAVKAVASLMRRRLCGKLHGGLSHLLFSGPARHQSIASFIADDRDLCLPNLHSTPPLWGEGHCRNIAMTLDMEKLECFGYPTVKKVRGYWFWQNSRTWRTDKQTHRRTLNNGVGRSYA